MKLLWILTVLASLAAGYVLFMTFDTADTAIQEASGAGLAIAIAAIPYILARAVEKLNGLE